MKNESDVAYLEQILERLRSEKMNPMTLNELNNRIDQSEADFENGKFKSHSDIAAKYSKKV